MNAQLRRAVELLASPSDDQERYLEELGTAPSADELAIEFSDALATTRASLDEAVRDAAAALDRCLEGMSGEENANLWTVEALHTSAEWKAVRKLASDLLQRMNVSDDRTRGA